MRRSPTPFESLRNDTAAFEEVRETLESAPRGKPKSVDELISRVNDVTESMRGAPAEIDRRAIVNFIEQPDFSESRIDATNRLPEAIVLMQGRPSLLIQNGDFGKPQSPLWTQRLDPYRSTIQQVIPSVGRIELINHPDFAWVGTAWVVEDRVLVTNRHVAEIFARGSGSNFAFIQNPFGVTVDARVDFREEYKGTQPFEVQVERVVYMAENSPQAPDLALLMLKQHGNLPAPLNLASRDARLHDPVAVIGYPAYDTRNDGAVMSRVFADIFDVKRMAPGEVSFVDSSLVFEHDCSTLGGNSGSAVVNYQTGEVVGLHFSGRFGIANYAVKAAAIKSRLSGQRAFSSGGLSVEARPTASDYKGRKGYDEAFLGRIGKLRVSMPVLSGEKLDDVVSVRTEARGRDVNTLDYTHFSVVMCKSRRMAYFTAVNIDGNVEVVIKRKNSAWLLDPRVADSDQVGDDFYARNKIDRGHLVRRMDPVWGTPEEASQAEKDTFHFTNAAPQHENLNQKEWLQLEDYLLTNTNTKDLKISVFTGPVFCECDPEYRGVRVPSQFWKVVAMVAPDGNLHATGYLLSQQQFLGDLEFVFGKFKTYQTSIRKIEKLTGLSFGTLSQHDPLMGTGTESINGDWEQVKRLDHVSDVTL